MLGSIRTLRSVSVVFVSVMVLVLLTVVVYEVGNAYSKKCRLEPGVQACDTFSLDDAASGVEGGRLRTFRFDLGAGRKRDERVSVCSIVISLHSLRSCLPKRTSEPWRVNLRLLQRAHELHCRFAERQYCWALM